jgi:hypothetical protein
VQHGADEPLWEQPSQSEDGRSHSSSDGKLASLSYTALGLRSILSYAACVVLNFDPPSPPPPPQAVNTQALNTKLVNRIFISPIK